jgi:hypothetical protein
MTGLIVIPDLTVTQRIGALVVDGKAWEDGYHAAHDRLYDLLARCLQFIIDIQPDTTEFDKFCQDAGRTFKKDTELANRVCSVVFHMTDKNRSRVSAYARVLKAAHKASKKPGELRAWIKERGGVEEIRLNSDTPQQQSDAELRREVEGRCAGLVAHPFKWLEGKTVPCILVVSTNGIVAYSDDLKLVKAILAKGKSKPLEQDTGERKVA